MVWQEENLDTRPFSFIISGAQYFKVLFLHILVLLCCYNSLWDNTTVMAVPLLLNLAALLRKENNVQLNLP